MASHFPEIFFRLKKRNKCPGCNSVNNTKIFSAPYSDHAIVKLLSTIYNLREFPKVSDAFELLSCADCGLIFQRYIIKDQQLKYFYGGMRSDSNSLIKRLNYPASQHKKSIRLLQALKNLLPKEKKKYHFLDFGMGWGHFANVAQTVGFAVNGLEISFERRQYATANFGINSVHNLRVLGSMDLISLIEVLEHVSQPLTIIQNISKHLNQGGCLVITVPNANYLRAKIALRLFEIGKNEAQPLEHINSFTKKSLDILMKKSGFRPYNRFFFIIKNPSFWAVGKVIKSLVYPGWIYLKTQ